MAGKKSIAIMQPYLFPYIGYMQLIQAVDTFVLYDDVNFITRGWINRNRILVNGREYLFTIPLKEASQNKLIKNVKLDDSVDWRGKFLKMIQISYAKAPFFDEVFPLIEKIISSSTLFIAKLILESLNVLNAHLDIHTQIIVSSEKYDNISYGREERIIDICKIEGAEHYINPIGGIEIYSKEDFAEGGVELNFLKSENGKYKQFENEFVPWLSIIDVLMFNSKEQIKNYLDEYTLI